MDGCEIQFAPLGHHGKPLFAGIYHEIIRNQGFLGCALVEAFAKARHPQTLRTFNISVVPIHDRSFAKEQSVSKKCQKRMFHKPYERCYSSKMGIGHIGTWVHKHCALVSWRFPFLTSHHGVTTRKSIIQTRLPDASVNQMLS